MSRPLRASLLAALALAVVGAIACEDPATPEPATPEPTEETPDPEATAEAEVPSAETEIPAIGAPPITEAERQAAARAREAAQHLGRTLKTRLMGAMAEGPEAAVEVCAMEAQDLTQRAADEQAAMIGRSSLRLRNPENRGPAWVTAWLEAHGERPAEGVTPSVGITGDPAVARFVGPIGMEGPCLMCHGAPQGIPEAVRSVLEARYPEDRATGYAAGDLRGAVWAEVPVAATEG